MFLGEAIAIAIAGKSFCKHTNTLFLRPWFCYEVTVWEKSWVSPVLCYDSDKSNSSRSQMFFKIGALKTFSIFTGKHLCESFISTNNVIKKRLPHRCFPVNIEKFLRKLFLKTTLYCY